MRRTGTRLRRANTTRRRTVSTVIGSMVEDSCCSVVPALTHGSNDLLDEYNVQSITWMKMNEGGATPKNVPIQKGSSGTPMTGDTMLINQLGRKGVIRRKRM